MVPDQRRARLLAPRDEHLVLQAGRGDVMITAQQIRAVLRAGGQVVDLAGEHVGQVVDVVLQPSSLEPAWLAIACPDGRVIVVPLAAAHQLGGCIRLPYTAAEAAGAPAVKRGDDPLSARQAAEFGRHFEQFGAEPQGAGREDVEGDAGHPEGHRLQRHPHTLDGHQPMAPGPLAVMPARSAGEPLPSGVGAALSVVNGHLPSGPSDTGSSIFRPGVDLPSGRDLPMAYPGAADGPWPTLTASSPGPPWWQRRQWRWPSMASSIRPMRRELRPLLSAAGLPADELDDLLLAASEAVSNAVEHAGQRSWAYFDVLAEVGGGWAGILIQDHGQWRASSDRGHRGRGLRLMDVLAETTLSVGKRGTTVVLRNRRASG